jgi:hypothetical protein
MSLRMSICTLLCIGARKAELAITIFILHISHYCLQHCSSFLLFSEFICSELFAFHYNQEKLHP